MSHSTTLVVLDGSIPESDIESELAEALEPFDENRTETENAKWDWYVVGGRWDSRILNATTTINHPGKPDSPWPDERDPWDEKTGGSNWLRKRDLTDFAGTFAFLSKDGDWHERGSMGWWGMVADEKETDAWKSELDTLVDKVEDNDWLVVVDVHI